MTVVEIGQALARHKVPDWYDEEPEGSEPEANNGGTVHTHCVASPTVAEGGFRFQRCGGGRRVIRRRSGD